MPGTRKGIASSVAPSFNASYQIIRLAVLVGICGGNIKRMRLCSVGWWEDEGPGGEIFLRPLALQLQ